MELDTAEIEATCAQYRIDCTRPLMLQVSAFDRFKDPVGVIHAYRLAKSFIPGLQLVLAGGGASDDPEGDVVLGEVRLGGREGPGMPGLQRGVAGGGASDDPEGDVVLAEVRLAAQDDPDVHVLLLPADAHRTINPLQRAAGFVLPESLA